MRETEITARVECIWPARAVLGEGPSWDPHSRRIYWIDIKGRKLHALEHATGVRLTWPLPWRLCSIAAAPPSWSPPRELVGANFLGCGDEGFGWLAVGAGEIAFFPIANPEAGLAENRFNDGKIGPDGRYWAGTMHDPETEDRGTFYAFSADRSVAALDTGYRVPNGPAFSPDGHVVYHNDSARRHVYAFDLIAGGGLANKRTLLAFSEAEGYPDGMTTDRDGNLLIAMWDGGCIQKIAPDGARLGTIAIPTARPTSCIFADDVCRTLYVTSASIGLAASDELAGGLFRVSL